MIEAAPAGRTRSRTLAARAKGAVAGFVQRDGGARRRTWTTAPGPRAWSSSPAQESGYLAELEDERTVEAQGRIENLAGARRAWRPSSSSARARRRTCDEFLEQVSLVGEQDEYDEEESGVTLMTLHIAKGLEFPVVFIVGLEDGVFPHYRSMTDPGRSSRRSAGWCTSGITRARERLYLTSRVEPDAVRATRRTTRRRGSWARSRRELVTGRSKRATLVARRGRLASLPIRACPWRAGATIPQISRRATPVQHDSGARASSSTVSGTGRTPRRRSAFERRGGEAAAARLRAAPKVG